MADKIIAVDFGGTSIRAALMSKVKIIRIAKYDTLSDQGKNVVLRQLVKAIQHVKGNEKIKGIGIGSPGPLLDGVLKNPPNLPFRNFNLKSFLERKFKVSVKIENDAKCAALAELNYGVRKKNFILLTLGTGIGGGIVIDGKLYKGQGYAGELGHIIIDKYKDLEYWASGKRLMMEAKKSFGEPLLARDLKEISNNKAKTILKKSAELLGVGVGSLINVFDPEIVVLEGGLKDAGVLYLKTVRETAQKYSILPKKVNIQWSKLENSGILGANLLFKK